MVSISNPAQPTLVTSYNLTSVNSGNENNDAVAVDAVGNILALARVNSVGQELFIFNITNPLAPNLISKLHLNGNPQDLKLLNNRIFIASDDNNKELQVVSISDPTLPSLTATFNMNQGDNSEDALTVDGNLNRLYVGREDGDTAPELYIFDINNPDQPSLLVTFEMGDDAGVAHISLS